MIRNVCRLVLDRTKKMQIKNITSIKEKLFKGSKYKQNFPKTVDFNFPQLYKQIVTQIKTTEISAECILYSAINSVNETNEFSDADYWDNKLEIKNHWFIGANGQGDLWLLNKDNKVLFYDHNEEKISIEKLIDLGLTFDKWLQFAFLNKDYEKILEKNKLNNSCKDNYLECMNKISEELVKNYPFEI